MSWLRHHSVIAAPAKGRHWRHLTVRQHLHTFQDEQTSLADKDARFFAQWLNSVTCLTRPRPCPADFRGGGWVLVRAVRFRFAPGHRTCRYRSINPDRKHQPATCSTDASLTDADVATTSCTPTCRTARRLWVQTPNRRFTQHKNKHSTTPCQHNRMSMDMKLRTSIENASMNIEYFYRFWACLNFWYLFNSFWGRDGHNAGRAKLHVNK